MKATPTRIPEVLVFEPDVYSDARGFFFESFNLRRFEAALGRPVAFVQDNHTQSRRNVLRGLHYQIDDPQGKLIRVVSGEIYDVAVDLRRRSPTFGRWVAETLSAENRRQQWIPAGFAHGFLVLSDSAEVLYKTTAYWSKEGERCIAWDDPALAIDWPLAGAPILSEKDRRGTPFAAAELYD